MTNKNIILIDGLNLLYRFFYGGYNKIFHPKTGKSINALFLFSRFLIGIKNNSPDYIAVCFDGYDCTSKKSEAFSFYKSNREAMPNDLSEQINLCIKAAKLLGCNPINENGFEADDIIAKIVHNVKNECSVTIYTNDKDFFQLIDDKVKIKRKASIGSSFDLYDAEKVKEKIGCYPSRVLDLLSIAGDSSDNIPGISGIGTKGALEIINNFDNIEDALNNKYMLSKRVASRLTDESLESFYISRKLADLSNPDCNVPELFMMNSKKISGEIYEFFQELGIGTLLEKILHLPEEQIKKKKFITSELFNQKNLKRILDVEITLLYRLDPTCLHPKKKFADIFIATTTLDNYIHIPQNLMTPQILQQVLDNAKTINLFNLKNFLHASHYLGFAVPLTYSSKIFDCCIAKYLSNPENDNQSEISIMTGYAKVLSSDFYYTIDLIHAVHDLQKYVISNKLEKTMDIDTRFSWVLFSMEKNGMFFDKGKMLDIRKALQDKVDELTKEIYEIAGSEFNIASPKQIINILFNKLNLSPSKPGTYTTNSTELKNIDDSTGIISRILQWRRARKNISTYIDGIIKFINKETDRVHPEFNLFGTATGRISCRNPNLQNLPTTNKGNIRSAIVPQDTSMRILSFDYSQMEIRVLAMLSQDEALMKILSKDGDIHLETASKIFNKHVNDINNSERSSAKAVNFGIMYGQHSTSLSVSLKITKDKAQDLIDNYAKQFPKVNEFIQKTQADAKKRGFVKTLFGRIRFVPQINESNFLSRSQGERIAINSKIQGTASDIIKLKMIDLYQELQGETSTKIILQIHDEIVLESLLFNKNDLNYMAEILSNSDNFSVALKVNAEFGI